MFALFYVVLAPLRRRLRRRRAQGQGDVHLATRIKVVGCLMMLFGAHPLLSYAIVGLGAAAYSPAKYGILTELLPTSQLVKANGWIEGLTIAVDHPRRRCSAASWSATRLAATCSRFDLPLHRHRHRHAARGGDRGDRRRSTSSPRCSTCASRAPRRRCSRSPHSIARAGARLLALQRAPVERQARPDLAGHHDAVLGRLAATCATSCSPGPRWRWATPRRRPRRWSAWSRSAPPPARSSPRCACGSTRRRA